jgi:hypothetical protein
MSDARRRKRQRDVAAQVDLATQAAYVAEGLRSGCIQNDWVVGAARLGHPVASALLGDLGGIQPFRNLADSRNRIEVIRIFWGEPTIRYLLEELTIFSAFLKDPEVSEILEEIRPGVFTEELAQRAQDLYDSENPIHHLNLIGSVWTY